MESLKQSFISSLNKTIYDEYELVNTMKTSHRHLGLSTKISLMTLKFKND